MEGAPLMSGLKGFIDPTGILAVYRKRSNLSIAYFVQCVHQNAFCSDQCAKFGEPTQIGKYTSLSICDGHTLKFSELEDRRNDG
jgi:hypothetical protein